MLPPEARKPVPKAPLTEPKAAPAQPQFSLVSRASPWHCLCTAGNTCESCSGTQIDADYTECQARSDEVACDGGPPTQQSQKTSLPLLYPNGLFFSAPWRLNLPVPTHKLGPRHRIQRWPTQPAASSASLWLHRQKSKAESRWEAGRERGSDLSASRFLCAIT